MTYPKINSQPMDSLRKKQFNYLRSEFKNAITMSQGHLKTPLSKKEIELLAWNCAFVAVIAK